MINIQFNATGLDRANKILAGLGSGAAIRATYYAGKRAAEKARTEAGRLAASEYTISKGIFMANTNSNRKVSVSGGSGGTSSISISFAGSVLPLLKFKTRVSKKGGVITQVKRGSSATLQHAFAVSQYGGNIFERIGAARFPIEGLYGPSTGHMMQNEKVSEEMGTIILDTFNERMEVEINRILNGW